jgi:hypothetical protein
VLREPRADNHLLGGGRLVGEGYLVSQRGIKEVVAGPGFLSNLLNLPVWRLVYDSDGLFVVFEEFHRRIGPIGAAVLMLTKRRLGW